MQRRTVIATLGATPFLTGYLEQVAGGLDSTDTPPSPASDDRREIQISTSGHVPETTPLSHSVEVRHASATADQPARLAVAVTNTTDQPVWNEARITAFSDFITDEGPDGHQLLLLQPDEQYPTVRAGCWRADLSQTQRNHAYTNVVAERQYAPGETKTTEFAVYGHPATPGPCLPPGEYPITSSYAVSTDSDAESPDVAYDWGFTIAIEDA